ncbi:MAG: hypothetical protein MK179_23070 [Pirellulaceae bacterium]|nr:hypothetical protein [Pirellulaceae bacterium]
MPPPVNRVANLPSSTVLVARTNGTGDHPSLTNLQAEHDTPPGADASRVL